MIIGNINFLKEIVVIMMGLALTSTLETTAKLLADGSLQWQLSLIFPLLVLNIIRFSYGNWMYLDKVSAGEERRGAQANAQVFLIVYLMVLSQSIIFVALSFYSQLNQFFFPIFVAVLVIDAVGFALLGALEHDASLERYWLFNNLLSAIALLAALVLVPRDYQLTGCLLLAYANTFIGFWLSWKLFYYPTGVVLKTSLTA